jgi:gamma-glutamylputrescine oxidase
MLDRSVSTEICIVGAGYTGLSAALHLARSGRRVMVLEAHRAGWGASGRNGGQVGSGQRRQQDELESLLGREHARCLWQLAQDAKDLVRKLITENAIECDTFPGIIHADHKPRFAEHSSAYVRMLNDQYGYSDIRYLDRDAVRDLVASRGYYSGTYDRDAFHMNPLKYALGLKDAAKKAGAVIQERTEVTGVTKGSSVSVTTSNPGGRVTADVLVLAANGYLDRLEPDVARHVMPVNNFIIATEPLGESKAQELIANNAAVADSRFVINYFRRSPDHRLLFGGGETYGYRFPADIKKFVRKPMLEVFPQLAGAQIAFGWGGTLAITMRRLPYFRRLAANIWSASGYSGHGISIATLSGRMIADAINGRSRDFDAMARLEIPAFPGGASLRTPLLALAMFWYALRDRL